MRYLHPKAIWLFFWKFFLGFGCVFLISGFWIVPFLFVPLAAIISGGAGAGIALFVVFFLFIVLILGVAGVSYFWAGLSYKNYRFEFTNDAVKIEKGVIWKKYVSIPYERIQNVDIWRGLLDRLLGLSDLHIQTAGYSGMVIMEGRLPGLDPKDAEELRDWLIKKIKGTKQGL